MTPFTFASLCSGGGLADIGYQAAGGTALWGVEIDPMVAAVYTANVGAHCVVADATALDFTGWLVPDLLHASPSCKHASTANVGASEAESDRAMGATVERALSTLRPRVFVLENVWGYVRFESFQRICATLTRAGHMWHYSHVNSADYGVPQTRKRLILRAVQGALLPPLPAPVPWVGWYAAIADLVDTLPASQFAEWQLKRLPAGLTGPAICSGTDATLRSAAEPMVTVTATQGKDGYIYHKAFLVPGANDFRPHPADQPAVTVTEDGRRTRAFLMDSQESNSLRDSECPAFTVPASVSKGPPRAWLDTGRVVRMTPRALARFQSVPDSYQLPAADKLACLVIGNGVPCRLTQRLAEGLIA